MRIMGTFVNSLEVSMLGFHLDKRQDEWIEKTFGSNQYGDREEEEEEEEDFEWDDEIDENFETLETEREK